MQVPDRAAHYVNVRIYKDALGKRHGSLHADYSMAALEWAFAGKSHLTKEKQEKNVFTPQHSIWEHRIDSKSNNPSVDEGDLWLQPKGDVLEIGKQLHPITGLECEYEECWGDIMVEVLGEEEQLVSTALVMDDSSRNARGMMIRIGTYCQGILQIGEKVTVERSQWSDSNQLGIIEAKEWSCTTR